MEELVQNIVEEARILKDKYTNQKNIPVNYACIFCQSEEEFQYFKTEAYKIGKVVQERSNSLLFRISPIKTTAGNLYLLRIRQPDESKPERGDADFTVADFNKFKEKYLKEESFSLIPRDGSEMIELCKENENIRVYFSAPMLINKLQSL